MGRSSNVSLETHSKLQEEAGKDSSLPLAAKHKWCQSQSYTLSLMPEIMSLRRALCVPIY